MRVHRKGRATKQGAQTLAARRVAASRSQRGSREFFNKLLGPVFTAPKAAAGSQSPAYNEKLSNEPKFPQAFSRMSPLCAMALALAIFVPSLQAVEQARPVRNLADLADL